jgi:hypothetical protein
MPSAGRIESLADLPRLASYSRVLLPTATERLSLVSCAAERLSLASCAAELLSCSCFLPPAESCILSPPAGGGRPPTARCRLLDGPQTLSPNTSGLCPLQSYRHDSRVTLGLCPLHTAATVRWV